ncbi:MAG TPA: YiiX/YebB-like N1pC/P60 family cysteine hydrolase [Bacteroidales bacterium]|nr:YiiX/YebB-like N1pC/P60 family cysteine hydrolase [Bacteroidales bacterium]
MKKIVVILFIIILSIAASLRLFLYAYEHHSMQEQSFYRYTLSDKEVDMIQDGDIILRHGYGLVSDMIVEQLDEQYDISHCAIVCKDDTGCMVVHSVSSSLSNVDGVQSQNLKAFIRDSHYNSVIVIRYKSRINKPLSAISRKAKYYLAQQVPFDNAFNIDDSSEFYCTELLWKVILNEYGDDIMKGKNNERKDHLRFDTFLDTTKFEIIINHHLRKKAQTSQVNPSDLSAGHLYCLPAQSSKRNHKRNS